MGRQAHFYMEREVFIHLAQAALDLGCIILKQSGNKLVSATDTSIITAGCSQYYFYLPQAGELDENLPMGCYNANGNVVIEAGYSTKSGSTVIHRSRLYMMSGYTGENGFVERPACLEELYKKLVKIMKKLTRHEAIPASKISTRLNYYADPTDRSHKIYITDKLLKQLQKPECILG
ncbi:MAG: hypothetical protein ACI4WS_09035 [Oscillospiraceae bacterium]